MYIDYWLDSKTLATPRTSIDMDGTLNFDWSHLGGGILAEKP